jgi:hypothetical protein
MKKENRQKRSVSAGFLAGAEGLEPSARGFGVDVRKRGGEQGRGGVAQFFQPARKKRCWFGAMGIFESQNG